MTNTNAYISSTHILISPIKALVNNRKYVQILPLEITSLHFL